MTNRNKKAISTINIQKAKGIETKCFHCPLKFHCALVVWGAWNVNLDLCNCTDDRLIALDNVLEVDQTLLKEWVKNNPKPRTYEYLGETYYID